MAVLIGIEGDANEVAVSLEGLLIQGVDFLYRCWDKIRLTGSNSNKT